MKNVIRELKVSNRVLVEHIEKIKAYILRDKNKSIKRGTGPFISKSKSPEYSPRLFLDKQVDILNFNNVKVINNVSLIDKDTYNKIADEFANTVN